MATHPTYLWPGFRRGRLRHPLHLPAVRTTLYIINELGANNGGLGAPDSPSSSAIPGTSRSPAISMETGSTRLGCTGSRPGSFTSGNPDHRYRRQRVSSEILAIGSCQVTGGSSTGPTLPQCSDPPTPHSSSGTPTPRNRRQSVRLRRKPSAQAAQSVRPRRLKEKQCSLPAENGAIHGVADRLLLAPRSWPLFPASAAEPDDGLIAFDSSRDGGVDIWVINADGSRPTRLTVAPGEDRALVWAPVGSRIAFQSTRDLNQEIYLDPCNGVGRAEPHQQPGQRIPDLVTRR